MASSSLWKRMSVLALLGLVGAVFFAFRETRLAAASVEALRGQVATLEQTRSEPAVFVREIRTQVSEPAIPEPAVPSEAGAAADSAKSKEPERESPELSPEEQEHRASVYGEARLKAAQDLYAGEALDPEWSSGAARALREAYSGEGFMSLAVSDCRSTLCRVDFRYTDPEGGPAESYNLRLRAPWRGPSFQKFDTATQQGTLYLAREGFRVPRVDPETLEY